MEKKENAETEEETSEKTGEIQVTLLFNDFSSMFFLSFSASLLSSRINAPRYPQFLHSQIDHSCGRPEAQKTLVEPHFGQNFTLCFSDLRLGF